MPPTIEEQLARIEFAIELNRLDKLEKIYEAQREHITSLESSNANLRATIKRLLSQPK